MEEVLDSRRVMGYESWRGARRGMPTLFLILTKLKFRPEMEATVFKIASLLRKVENCKYLGCKNTDLKTVLYCQKCLMGVHMKCKNLKIFRGLRPRTPATAPSAALSATSVAPLSPKVKARFTRLNWTWGFSKAATWGK